MDAVRSLARTRSPCAHPGSAQRRGQIYKPGSVRNVPAVIRWCIAGHHPSRTTVADHLQQPTRDSPSPAGRTTRRCLALLPARFAVRYRLPVTRWALTPPFHPYRANAAVSFLWHFLSLPLWQGPGVTRCRVLWSPDFPRDASTRGNCASRDVPINPHRSR